MNTKKKLVFTWLRNSQLAIFSLVLVTMLSGCGKDYPALIGYVTKPTSSTSSCACTTSTTATQPSSGTTTSGSSTTAGSTQPLKVDTLDTSPPQFTPNGGNFHFSTTVRLTADTLPPQAVYEFSVDNGQSWQSGQQFTVTTGGNVLTRFRVGDKVSRSRSASFSIYFERMMIVGNSIMNHDPAPSLGWFNTNGMAASAPQYDFVHLLTARLQSLYPAMTVKLQLGVDFERTYGQPGYSIDEFNQPLQDFKPDLIVIRLGENVADEDVQNRQFESQFRQLVERLAGYGQPVRIVTTTSVWNRPQTDAVIRKVIAEKGYPLVDLSSMVGQGQYFASQYADPGVAAHPNDVGMARIAELIWAKFQ